MKKALWLLLPLITACTQRSSDTAASGKEKANPGKVPPPNTVVASDSMRIADPLNTLYFGVEVIAGDQSSKGVYNILAHYGYNDASGELTMPAAEEPIIPRLRRGKDPSEFIIGFRYGSDTSFNDYFLVSGHRGVIEMKYLKAYSFK